MPEIDPDRLLATNAAAPDLALAAQAFAALGSEARLEVLRRLVRAGPDGLAVGALGERLGVAPSTLTHHLKFLTAAGLMDQERRGRTVLCRARFDRVEALADFLTRECCRDSSAAKQSSDGAPSCEEESAP